MGNVRGWRDTGLLSRDGGMREGIDQLRPRALFLTPGVTGISKSALSPHPQQGCRVNLEALRMWAWREEWDGGTVAREPASLLLEGW